MSHHHQQTAEQCSCRHSIRPRPHIRLLGMLQERCRTNQISFIRCLLCMQFSSGAHMLSRRKSHCLSGSRKRLKRHHTCRGHLRPPSSTKKMSRLCCNLRLSNTLSPSVRLSTLSNCDATEMSHYHESLAQCTSRGTQHHFCLA